MLREDFCPRIESANNIRFGYCPAAPFDPEYFRFNAHVFTSFTQSGVAMGLWDRLVGRGPADLIEWVEPAEHDKLAVRYSGLRLSGESALLVRPGQACVVCSGEVADVLGPGRHQLNPSVLPKLAAAHAVREAGSAFRADVSFVSVIPHADVRWATAAAVVARDSNHAAIPAKANGEIGFVVTDPAAFVREVVAPGDGPGATRSEVAALVTSQFGEIFRTGDLDGADLLGPVGRLGLVAGEKLATNLRVLGITLIRFLVKTVTVSVEVRRPMSAPSSGAADGYRAELPAPLFPDIAPTPLQPTQPTQPPLHAISTGFPALPAGLADVLEPPLPRNTGPKSARLPLANDAPEGIFAARQPNSGPRSDRLLMGQSTAAGVSENGTASESLFDLNGTPTPQLASAVPAPVAPSPPAAAITAAVSPTGAGTPAATVDGASGRPAPPPLPATLEYHVAISGTAVGPFDLLVLAARVRDGSVGRKSLVWRPGMDGWLAAESVTELAPLFVGPPPLPPM